MKALVIRQQDEQYTAQMEDFTLAPEVCMGKVKVAVSYSGLNYKDALALTGKGKIIRQFPMIAGIDLVGEVIESPTSQFEVGQKVLLTGFGYGENRFGGFAEFAYVDPQHLVLLPENLSERDAMLIGTAGFTAMLCVNALLEANVTPNKGEVLVTGASGGVGSAAIFLLHKLGYQVGAVTGNLENQDWLIQLGASRIYPRADFDQTSRPLEKQQFAGLIDCVGGRILSNALSKLDYNACAAICGLAQNFKLDTTVMPFILRNVRLQGIDSVLYSIEKRELIWQQMAHAFDQTYFQLIGHEIDLAQAPDYANKLMANQIKGRIAVKIR